MQCLLNSRTELGRSPQATRVVLARATWEVDKGYPPADEVG